MTPSVRSLWSYLRLTSFALVLASLASPLLALTWFPFGPDGGDARAFAADPQDHTHLFLGTVNGWIYDSHNRGQTWKRLARVGNRDDLALDNIVVDPRDVKHILVGAWVLGKTDGGLFVSRDGGLTWTSDEDMKGQSVRSLTMAPSDSKIVIAGTLQGVFRSEDSGTHWSLISPAGSKEIHEVESVAIDPLDPTIIYAGTWHLPWKSTDGGATWNNIKQGIIEDSDVFSIIVDPKQPKVVYASACSGIYKSVDGGGRFTKVQGIPSTARRTRVLMQDPGHLDTVYAGTTEGLFRTDDAGSYWTRTTSDDVIVNDVFVDPTDSKRVLLATDRAGVLASQDGGTSFSSSNTGFSTRQVTAYTSDPHTPSNLYVGVVNNKEWGGVFFSKDGGLSWLQHAQGLDGRDVFSLGEAENGTLVAGTEHGLYSYDRDQQIWNRVGDIGVAPVEAKPKKGAAPVKRGVVKAPARTGKQIEGSVTGIANVGQRLFAVSTDGVFTAEKAEDRWVPVRGAGEGWQMVASANSVVLLANLTGMTVSVDGGRSWKAVALPPAITQVGSIAVDGQGELWAGGREGAYVSKDNGMTWTQPRNLYIKDVNSIFYDARGQRVLLTGNQSTTMAYAVRLPDLAVSYWDTGWNLRFVRPVGDYLVGATTFDGVVVQPRMVKSDEAARH